MGDSVRIDGSTSAAQRPERVKRFQEMPSVRVALLSITAAGTGLTLTAAHMVVFAELYWVPGQLCQAEDRAHRIGQKSSVTVQYLIAKDTLDECLYNALERKTASTSEILNGYKIKLNASCHTPEAAAQQADSKLCAQALASPCKNETKRLTRKRSGGSDAGCHSEPGACSRSLE